jgi:hypothetical protein
LYRKCPGRKSRTAEGSIEAYAKKYQHSFGKLISNTYLAADLMETMFGA